MSRGEFGIVKLLGQETLSTRSLTVGGYLKSYLGEQGRQLLRDDLGKKHWKLRPGWEKADLALVSHQDSGQTLGIVAEYADGTFALTATGTATPTRSRLPHQWHPCVR